MGVAFLGVSGTIPYGKEIYCWSEDPAKDLTRIDAALAEVKGRLTPAEGQIILLGFSEGAWLAGELAARHPDRFAGAVVMSPRRRSSEEYPAPEPRDEHRRQRLLAVCGAEETAETVRTTKDFADRFEKLGARVSLTLYPGKTSHTLPPDYVEKLPVWGRFILDPEAAAPK
jgi:predicted esterase